MPPQGSMSWTEFTFTTLLMFKMYFLDFEFLRRKSSPQVEFKTNLGYLLVSKMRLGALLLNSVQIIIELHLILVGNWKQNLISHKFLQ